MNKPTIEQIEERIRTGNSGLKLRPGYGETLTRKRIEKGLTKKKLSEISGVPGRNLSNIEKGNGMGFSFHDLRRYLACLDIPPSEVFYD